MGLNNRSSTNYSYDDMSRLASVGGAGVTASYSRVAGTSLLSSTSISDGSTNVLTTDRTYDNINRLTSIASLAPLALKSSSYVYNNADKRVKAADADSSYWRYSYDKLGQVVSGVKRDSSGQPIPGFSFGYGYDTIGNRITSHRGTEAQSYTSNNLNQYLQRTIPNQFYITGRKKAGTFRGII